MGIDYYLVHRASRRVFDLGKSGGHGFNEHVLTQTPPQTQEECRAAVRLAWLGGSYELSPNEYEETKAGTRQRPWLKREGVPWEQRWRFVEEFGCYILMDRAPEDARGGWSARMTEEEVLQDHRGCVAFSNTLADRIWAYVQDEGIAGDWAGIELINDGGDLPWWEYDSRAWFCIGSRYTEDIPRLPRRLDRPPRSTITFGGR